VGYVICIEQEGMEMTLEQIKAAVDAGKNVFWKQYNYKVKKYASGYVIECLDNGHAVGLTWRDGVTMNGDPEDFFGSRHTVEVVCAGENWCETVYTARKQAINEDEAVKIAMDLGYTPISDYPPQTYDNGFETVISVFVEPETKAA
jgi:hypothetical protein